MAELDPNVVVATLVGQGIEKFAKSALGRPTTAIRRTWQGLADAYRPYLEQTFTKVSTTKTFLKTNEPSKLLDIYVPLKAQYGDELKLDQDIIEAFEAGKKIVVSGLAGRGKSMLLRYIATASYYSSKGVMPLFLELRALNKLTDKDILSYIHSTYSGHSSINFADFQSALRSGKFSLILDGFDEVDHDTRVDVENRILQIARNYPKAPLIISSRPDRQRFGSWEKFHHFKLAPLDLQQVRDLVEKSDSDEEFRKIFLRKLDENFYSEHREFLGTPLLALLLMLTYQINAEIPKTLHTFYENAFATLVKRHDAMKSQFSRKTYSNCSVAEFSSIFSAFCFLSYCKWDIQFSEAKIDGYLRRALRKCGIDVSAEKVLKDFVEGICVLQLEGNDYFFVHRSFQEYFAALFLSRSPLSVAEMFIDKGKSRYFDKVVPMWFAMDRDRLEKEWVSKAIDTVERALLECQSSSDLFSTLVRYVDVNISKGRVESLTVERNSLGRRVEALYQMYCDEFEGAGYHPAIIAFAHTKRCSVRLESHVRKALSVDDDLLNEFNAAVDRSQENQTDEFVMLDVSQIDQTLIKEFSFDSYDKSLRQAIPLARRNFERSTKRSGDFVDELFPS